MPMQRIARLRERAGLEAQALTSGQTKEWGWERRSQRADATCAGMGGLGVAAGVSVGEGSGGDAVVGGWPVGKEDRDRFAGE